MPAIRCSVREAIDQCDSDAWDEIVRASRSGVFMARGFVSAVEDAFRDRARFAHAVVYDDGCAVACGSFCALPIDFDLLADGLVRRITAFLGRSVPSLLRRTIVFCGLPVSVGARNLAIVPEARRRDILRAMHDFALWFARREGAPYIVFKEFSPGDRPTLESLQRLGYRQFSSPPMNAFDHRFTEMESYTAALRSRYRQCVRRSLAKSRAAGLRFERITDPGAIARLYTPALHRLYEAVALSSEHRLELLPFEFFRALSRRLPGQVGLTAVYAGDRVAAFNWNLFDGDTYHFLFAGLDYDLNRTLDLYFNLMYAEMDCAFHAGAGRLALGQTADDFKTRLGCHQERRFFCVAPTGGVAALILRAAGAFLLPEPPRWATHHVFREPDPAPDGRCRCR